MCNYICYCIFNTRAFCTAISLCSLRGFYTCNVHCDGFSPFDGCERVNEYLMFGVRKRALVINPLVYILRIKEKIALKIAAKIASVNGHLQGK